ncbi:hypothetical protein [Flavobacterium sp.]|uniref:hypothetical protein n=1 Tax=Flavobacterium sp. TaxID=239 RepID=UPI0037533B83
MISKEKFVLIIESLKTQYLYDEAYAFGLSELIKTEDVVMYDNSVLIHAVINLLQQYFPKDKEGFCEIEFYCYVLNFGKNGEEYESSEEFYDRLVGNNKVSSIFPEFVKK